MWVRQIRLFQLIKQNQITCTHKRNEDDKGHNSDKASFSKII